MSLEQIARDMKLGVFPAKSELTKLEEQILILAAKNAELLMALEQIARKKKMDAVAAVSMKAIATDALRASGIRC